MNIDCLPNHLTCKTLITEDFATCSAVDVVSYLHSAMVNDFTHALSKRVRPTCRRYRRDDAFEYEIRGEVWVFSRDELLAFIRQIQIELGVHAPEYSFTGIKPC